MRTLNAVKRDLEIHKRMMPIFDIVEEVSRKFDNKVVNIKYKRAIEDALNAAGLFAGEQHVRPLRVSVGEDAFLPSVEVKAYVYEDTYSERGSMNYRINIYGVYDTTTREREKLYGDDKRLILENVLKAVEDCKKDFQERIENEENLVSHYGELISKLEQILAITNEIEDMEKYSTYKIIEKAKIEQLLKANEKGLVKDIQ